MLKLLLLLLFSAAVISLFSGLFYLIKGNRPERVIQALYARVICCIILFVLVVWGFYTGQLSSTAPWL